MSPPPDDYLISRHLWMLLDTAVLLGVYLVLRRFVGGRAAFVGVMTVANFLVLLSFGVGYINFIQALAAHLVALVGLIICLITTPRFKGGEHAQD